MTVEACRDPDGDRQARTCRMLMRQREIVRQVFGRTLCANASWDMLLALYASERESRKIMLTALCAASHVPEATAYRKIDELERRDLIVRAADTHDRRRVYIRLTSGGIELIASMLTRIAQLVEAEE